MLNRMRKTKALSTLALTGAVLASTVTLASGASAAENIKDDDFKFAYGGSEDEATGIVWGVGPDGSYMVPVDGVDYAGWCIDPGRKYPKQDEVTQYGPAEEWAPQNALSTEQRSQLAVALFLGNAVTDGTVGKAMLDQIQSAIDTMGIPGVPAGIKINNIDHIAAAVSGVVHKIGHDSDPQYGGGSKPWDPSSLTDPNSRAIYDLIMVHASSLGGLISVVGGGGALEEMVTFKIRKPTDGSQKQRMIVMNDITFKLPGFELPPLPPIDPPTENTPPTTPPTTPGTPDTTTPPTTPGTTTTPPTTPGTPDTTTPPTTPGTTTTPPTTPKEKEPEIRTSAGSSAQNIVEKDAVITDTVRYSNLEVGKEYTIVGETVDKSTGKKDGNKGTATFTAKESNGAVDVPIKLVNATADQLVVFERLYEGENPDTENDKPVAVHEDIEDKAQTIGRIPSVPEIRTSASSSTGNFIQSGTTVSDTVRFHGLVPGLTYRLETRLMNKDTGEDTGASQSMEFTPDTAAGEVVVEGIQVTDPDAPRQVVFEKLYQVDKEKNQNYLVATHEDLDDAAQTVGGDESIAKKKKKKAPESAPVVNSPSQAPLPIGNGNGPAPAPAPVGGGGSNNAAAPRQVINSVPSGESSGYGSTIFNR